MKAISLEKVAIDADVEIDYLRRLIEMGAFQPRSGKPYGASDARRVHLLRTWENAGFPVERVMELVRDGLLSMNWLEAPVATRVERIESTYEQLCKQHGVALAMVRALYEALGFAPPQAGDRARLGDGELLDLVRRLRQAGVRAAAILAMMRVYAVGLRRIAKAESELYESEVEEPLRRAGSGEQELMDSGARFMDIALLERVMLDVYRRQREHVWIEHRIAHAELALERAGLHQSSPPAICFVDLSGYTRAVDESSDEIAARLAARLTPLVEEISRRHGGRPIRWLGDGGMFHFKQPGAAVHSALDMVECVPHAGLPPVHIGIHSGSVIFQDGDVYGKTVNLAARIAAYAPAGHVLVSDEIVRACTNGGFLFERLGEVTLKGISMPVTVHRAVRGGRQT